MSTYTQIIYQIIFSTKYRHPVLEKQHRKKLFRFIWGTLKNNKCHLHQINGVEDHLHVLVDLHPSIALADLIKDIKLGSSHIKKKQLFAGFTGWQEGYAAFTYSRKEKERLVTYVKKQQEHHKILSFKEELIGLLQEHGVAFDEKYLL